MAKFDWFWNALGAKSAKHEKQSRKIVDQAQQQAADLEALSDAELADRARATIDAKGEIADKSTFLAVLATASSRHLGLRPFDVQSQAVLRLLTGDVIHMATGEGKTLVGAMAATGLALSGKRVHVVTVNDYLARRDAEWMRPLVESFGLVVAAVTESMTAEPRRQAYGADVVYAPVTELGFDVLRDNQISSRDQAVFQQAEVALVDEADSVLVDEALVPLVLAGTRPDQATDPRVTSVVAQLQAERDYTIDADGRNVFLTDEGAARVERYLGIESLYSDEHIGTTLVRVNLALHAKALLIRDIHYLVHDGEIKLIDTSKGRIADLQRWPDGLQAAVEEKEGLKVTEGGRILDTLTIQELMRRYPQLCGMTGTAVEATDQLREFYGLYVSEIAPNKPVQRFDEADRVFATIAEKNQALVDEIELLHTQNQPVLIGTQDVAESESLEQALAQRGINARVLNAKNDAEEAAIVAEAGMPGRVTVSTQMAGRGTDIKLGGTDGAHYDEVKQAGGLAVLGTTRHRSSRLDNQLRGRAGRQGDPGLSLFFVSLEDDVVVTGGAGESVEAQPDEHGRIDSPRIVDFIAHCQRVTEAQLLEIHSQTWKYNKLLADQREIIDERRTTLLDTARAWEELAEYEPERAEQLRQAGIDHEVLVAASKEIMLYHLDLAWADHLEHMDDVRESIHLRAIARETPVDEYHRIAVREFKEIVRRGVEAARKSFCEVTIDSEGAHLADDGLARPSATWTYMVSDNPLAGSGNSALSGIGNLFR